jgi:hypothetical protein
MQRQSLKDRAESVRRTRESATATLAEVLASDLNGLAESEICAAWLASLQAIPHLMAEGWYQPPPKGLSILIGNPPDYERLRYQSLRDEVSWPRGEVRLSNDSLLFAYASPVNKSTGMIGDLAISLYKGNDQNLREHLSNAFDVTARVARFAALGMEFRELYAYGARLISERGVPDSSFSLSNHTGLPDVGHTAPWSFGNYPSEAVEAIESGNPALVAKAIAGARLFIGASETTKIQANMSFSVEPRIAHPTLPVACFHAWITFVNGVKSICAGFGPLLDLFGMRGYLDAEAVHLLS